MAAGTSQGTAYDLTTQATLQTDVFATVPLNSGVALNGNFLVGQIQTLVNEGANTLTVYPPKSGGGTINGGASSPLTLAAGVMFVERMSATDWRVVAGGVAGGGGGGSVTSVTCGAGLSGGTITGSGTCAVIYGTGVNTAIQGSTQVTHSCGWAWSTLDVVQAGTYPLCTPEWASGGSVTLAVAYTGGTSTPSFLFTIAKNGGATGCNLSVSSTGTQTQSCIGVTWAAGDQLAAIVNTVVGSPSLSYVGLTLTSGIQ